jgi:glycosyltransferase involved in cell wall biosynthesis
MRLVVTTEARFSLDSSGIPWTESTFDYLFWQRYLSVFDEVRIVARAAKDCVIGSDFKRVTGPGVELFPLPFYLGPRQFVSKRREILRALRHTSSSPDAILARVSSPIATELLSLLPSGRPYGLEVVGDPDEGMAPGTVEHPLRPVFRWLGTRNLKRHCRNAAAVAYVTRETLQRKYSPGPSTFSTHYSSVMCKPDDFVGEPRSYDSHLTGPARLIFVGSFTQMYKGPDVLLRAVKDALPFVDIHLTMLGEGKHRGEMEALASQLGIANRVTFPGSLPAGKAVRDQLDLATLFVLPSRTEGLPRAMIEAMARALPCLGTRVGGIPELLPEQDLVPADDPAALASKFREVLNSSARLASMSKRNLETAKEYGPEPLARRRNDLYGFLRKVTEKWLAKTPVSTDVRVLVNS